MGRILVIGATGLIGAPVARRLLADGHSGAATRPLRARCAGNQRLVLAQRTGIGFRPGE